MCRVCYRRCSLRRQGAETIQSQYLLTLLIHAVSFPAGRGSESFVHSLIFMLLDLCANAKRFLLLGVPTPKHPQLKGFLPSKDKSFSKKYTKCKWIGGTECVERMIPILSEGALKGSICSVLGYGPLTLERTNTGLPAAMFTRSLFCQSC